MGIWKFWLAAICRWRHIGLAFVIITMTIVALVNLHSLAYLASDFFVGSALIYFIAFKGNRRYIGIHAVTIIVFVCMAGFVIAINFIPVGCDPVVGWPERAPLISCPNGIIEFNGPACLVLLIGITILTEWLSCHHEHLEQSKSGMGQFINCHPWFQFSLLMPIAVILAASGLLWLNVRTNIGYRPEFIVPGTLPANFSIEKDAYKVLCPEPRHGWPFDFATIKPDCHPSSWEITWIDLAKDVVVCIAILLTITLFCESLVRRHDRRRQAKREASKP